MRPWILAVAITMVASACGSGEGAATPTPRAEETTVAATSGEEPSAPAGEGGDTPTAQPSGEALAYALGSRGEVFGVDPDSQTAAQIAEVQNASFVWVVDSGVWIGERENVFHLDGAGNQLGVVEMFGVSSLAEEVGVIWLVSLAETEPHSFLSKVDAGTHTVEASLPSTDGEFLDRVAVGGGFVWITGTSTTSSGLEPAVSRVDPDSMTMIGTTPLGIYPESMAWGEGSLWVAGGVVDGSETQVGVTRISPDGTVEAEISITGVGEALRTYNTSVAVGHDAVWVIDAAGTELVRIDPATETEVGRIPVGPDTKTTPFVARVHISGGRVWVDNPADDFVYAIDPQTNEATPEFPYPGRAIAFKPEA